MPKQNSYFLWALLYLLVVDPKDQSYSALGRTQCTDSSKCESYVWYGPGMGQRPNSGQIVGCKAK